DRPLVEHDRADALEAVGQVADEVADLVGGEGELLVALPVHEMEAVVVAIEELYGTERHGRLLDALAAAERLVEHLPGAEVAHPDLGERAGPPRRRRLHVHVENDERIVADENPEPTLEVARRDHRSASPTIRLVRGARARRSLSQPWPCAKPASEVAMIKVYGVAMSRAFRPLWLLEELGVPYEHVKTSFIGETRTPEFLRLNPNGHIPVLQDGDLTLWESMAINLYLARKYDKGRWPKTVEGEGRAYQWSVWGGGGGRARAGGAVLERAPNPPLPPGGPARREEGRRRGEALRAAARRARGRARPLAVPDRGRLRGRRPERRLRDHLGADVR